MRELARVYGHAAGDMRYQPKLVQRLRANGGTCAIPGGFGDLACCYGGVKIAAKLIAIPAAFQLGRF